MSATAAEQAPHLPFLVPPPPPLPGTPDGLDVRIAAEYASDVRDQSLYFTYADGSMIGSGTPLDPPPLPEVFTSADADRPRLDWLNISLTSELDLEIPGTGAGALFWSESAVEKFLLPYYASLYGWEAVDLLLGKVRKAWFDYAGLKVQVVALAYAWGAQTESGKLGLTDSVQVVYADVKDGGELGPLKKESLDLFVGNPAHFPPGSEPELGPAQPVANPSGVVGTVPYTGAGTLSSIDLRELAEFARGLRGQFLYFETGSGGVAVQACPGMTRCDGPAGAFTCATSSWRTDRPAPARLSAFVDGEPVTILGPGSILPAPPDSIFWTDGALEKLMLPYYASVMGRQAPFFTGLLLGQWEQHMDVVPPAEQESEALAVEALQNMMEGTGPAPTGVFAVVHLPLSEYIPETLDGGFSQALRNRTRLLRLDATGFHADPVSR